MILSVPQKRCCTSMKVTKLKIDNYGGFDKLELDFNPGINVLTGENGAGKSTVLRAVAHMLNLFTYRLAETKNVKLSDASIKNGENYTSVSIACDGSRGAVSWSSVRARTGKLAPVKSHLEELNQYVRNLKADYTESPESVNFPVIAYYPTSRTWFDIPQRIRSQHEFSPLHTYAGNPESGVDFRLFFEWFRQRQERENNHKLRLYTEGNASLAESWQDGGLKAVRRAFSCFFKNYTRMSVETAPLRLEICKEEDKLSFQQLSDGEKALLSLVADIAFRLYLANPNMEKTSEGEGIILIDEIELHLHPAWQKNVIPNLQKAFPNCQFIISTHSPLVLNRIEKGKSYYLKNARGNISVKSMGSQYGYRPETVMSEGMGGSGVELRPEGVSQALKSIYNAIDGNQFEKAHGLLDKLSSVISGDAELTRINMLLKRKELLRR